MGTWIAAAQLCSTEDVASNLKRASAIVKEASAAGAALVGLPENFAYLGADRDHKLSIAEAIDDASPGPILGAMRETARAARAWLLLGGFPERVPEAGGARIGNTSVLGVPWRP